MAARTCGRKALERALAQKREWMNEAKARSPAVPSSALGGHLFWGLGEAAGAGGGGSVVSEAGTDGGDVNGENQQGQDRDNEKVPAAKTRRIGGHRRDQAPA